MQTAIVLALAVACASAVTFTPTPHLRVNQSPLFTPTALDEYIALPDPNYSYFDTGVVIKGDGYDIYVLNMTSQQWLTYADVDRSIWFHYMSVVVPHTLDWKTQGTLYITGGDNTDGLPNGGSEDEELCIAIALFDKIVCSVLFQIPNQPIVFADDPNHESRSEDAMVAWTWYHFMSINNTEPFWLARLPMTKAAVRAMDTVTDYIYKKSGNNITEFIVAGASKRGWTTWTTGAVDYRVIAIIPVVMDALNFIPNVHHFWQAYGGWTFALDDYYKLNFTRQLDDPNLVLMTNIIDPLVYADRLTMPKLVIDAGGDEFFMLDDNHFWYDKMQGETHLVMVQDAEHSMATGVVEVVESATSFVEGVLMNSPRPSMTWDYVNGTTSGSLTLYTSEPPLKVHVWHSDTLQSERRDWRLVTGQIPCPTIEISGDCFQPVLWYNTEPTQLNATTFTVSFNTPESGWRAFFMTADFKGETITNYKFSSQVVIIPNTFPFPPCSGDGCYGTLL